MTTQTFQSFLIFFSLFIGLSSCKKDDSSTSPAINVAQTQLFFPSTIVEEHSLSKTVSISGTNISQSITATATPYFQVSLDNTNFSSSVMIAPSAVNQESSTVYVRFSPSVSLGEIEGTLTFSSSEISDEVVSLTGNAEAIPREIQTIGTITGFEETTVGQVSAAQSIQIKGLNLEANVTATVSGLFEISSDNINFSSTVNYDFNSINLTAENLYVRFIPGTTDLGEQTGSITLSADGVNNVVIDLSGTALPITHNYVAFNQEPIAFGGGYNQSATQTFTLHPNLDNISEIKMFLQIDCPNTGCDDWDRFANVKVKNPATGNWFEIGRYITPYWVGTELLPRGLEFDVTDFKSLLTGSVELRIYIENWTTKADLITVDFDFIEGTPDYPFYSVAEVLPYHINSIDGVPYGESHNFDLDKQVTVPANAADTHLRTIISGWGHAYPNDSDGRPCAEWCFRTHDIKIDGVNTFQHNMGPIGCASNPINNQSPGNWTPDRAGWCPGMAVPTRVDIFDSSVAGTTFSFEYDYEDWTNNMQNGRAFYATSTYVVVKSNTAITPPTVN